MTTNTATRTPIVLIHGLWMTPRSWEHWVSRFEAMGHRVLAPAYPGLEVEVEALRADPSPIEQLTIDGVADHYEAIIRDLDTPPILMGHSFGGTLVQILLDRGLGSAGVAIDSGPVKGIKVVPISQIRSTLPVLDNPANRHKAVPFTPDQFHYAFTNVLTKEESREVYDRYHVAAPGRILFDGVLANFQPNSEAAVNFKKADRAPLLFIAGGEDHIMPPSVNRSNYEHQLQSGAITDYTEFAGRSHYTCGLEGWEPIADYALGWATDKIQRLSARNQLSAVR